jgi:succinoglycan biosynthesis transport protein ExoP
VELRHYYDVLRKRIWVILLLVVIAVTGVAFQLSMRPDLYQADVAMMITPRIIAPTAFEDPELSLFATGYRETMIGNMMLLIKSDAVLKRVQQRIGKISLSQLRSRVTVETIGRTDFLVIKASDPDAARAAAIANATAEEFTKYYAEVNAAGARAERTFIEGQLGQTRQRLDDAEQALLGFKERTGIVAPREHVSWMVQRLLDMQAAQETAKVEQQIARTRINFIRSRIGSQGEMRRASVSIGTSPTFGRLRDTLTGLELDLASLRQVYTDQHPRVLAVVGRIADTRKRMAEVAETSISGETMGVNPIRDNLMRAMIDGEVDAVAAQARAAGTAAIASRLETRVNSFPKDEAALARLGRDVGLAETLFIRLSTLRQEALIRENKAATTGQAALLVVDPAAAPVRPQSKELPVRAGMAGLLGLVLGAGLALLMESMDTRIRTSGEAEASYGLPVLASIPTMNSRTHRQLTTAPATSALLLSIITMFLIGGLIVGFYALQGGAAEGAARIGQAILQTIQGSQ